MRSLVSIAVVAALGTSAGADVSGTFRPLPKHSIGVAIVMGASSFGGVNEGGAGIDVELAIARRRVQYFGEGSVAAVGLSVADTTSGAAVSTRIAGGIRWVARSITADEVAIDLLLEGFAGVEHVRWSDDQLTRPQVGGGIGWQVRMPKLAVRLSTRLYVAPTSDDAAIAVCRGTCPAMPATASYGFMGLFGVAW